jgi:hypothetical protein
MKGGDEDMSIAEDFGRKRSTPCVLKRDLQFHAELLNRMNRPKEAQAKLDEAAKLLYRAQGLLLNRAGGVLRNFPLNLPQIRFWKLDSR